MKLEARITAFLATIAVALAAPCFAEISVKDLIFRDCPKSLSTFRALPDAEQKKLIPFLREVLKLKIESLSEALPAMPGRLGSGVPGSDPDLGSIWRSFSPDRELDAKSCALKLLSSAPDAAIAAIPDILNLASDPTITDELLDQIDSSLYVIGPALSGETPATSSLRPLRPEEAKDQVLESDLVAAAIDHLDLLGDNVLAFMPTYTALREIWAQSPKFNTETQSRIVAFLPWLDPSGVDTQRSAFENPTANIDKTLLARVLGNVRCPDARAVRYLRDFTAAESASDKSVGRVALKNLIQNLNHEPRCPADWKVVSGSDVLTLLFEDLPSGDGREGERLELALPLLAGRNNARAIAATRNLLAAATQVPNGTADVVTPALAAIGSQARDIILDTLNGKNPAARQRASSALEKLQIDDAKKLRPFVVFLTDSDADVRANIYRALLPAAKELRSDIRRNFGSSNSRQGNFAALALSKAGASTDISNSVLVSSLSEFPCSVMSQVAEAAKANRLNLEQDLSDKAHNCLQKSSDDACQTIAWITSFDAIEKKLASEIISHFDRQNASCILNAYRSAELRKRLSLTPASVAALIRSNDENISEKAAELTATMNSDAASLIPVLREAALATETAPTRRRSILQVLGALQPDIKFWKDLLREIAESGRANSFSSIGCIDSVVVLDALKQVYSEAVSMQKPALARMIGWFGPRAAEFGNNFLELLGSKNCETRYEGAVAALRVSDQPQNILPYVTSLLQSHSARRLTEETFPLAAHEALESLSSNTSPLQARLVNILNVTGPSAARFENRICGKE